MFSRVSDNVSPVDLKIVDGVARLTLNRPERKNAINADTHRHLIDALDRIESDPSVRVLVYSGAGGAFCAGQDLSERAEMLSRGPVDLARSLHDNFNPLVRRLVALPMPTIAVVNGVAAGAGASIALAADIVLASRSARFQLAFARVGLGPDSGISWMLPRLVGTARALGMALTADAVDAVTAEAWGLIWRCVDDAALNDTADQLVRNLRCGASQALRAIKRRLRDAATETLDVALDAERDMQGVLGMTEDYRAAVEAFVAKRPATFS